MKNYVLYLCACIAMHNTVVYSSHYNQFTVSSAARPVWNQSAQQSTNSVQAQPYKISENDLFQMIYDLQQEKANREIIIDQEQKKRKISTNIEHAERKLLEQLFYEESMKSSRPPAVKQELQAAEREQLLRHLMSISTNNLPAHRDPIVLQTKNSKHGIIGKK